MQPSGDRMQAAIGLMARFAVRTGLESDHPPRRYLWTDAFAVCNYLAMARVTGEARFTATALRLVEQVHGILGRHRSDDTRRGWISGLSEREGREHPTLGGLRIGKKLPERRVGESFDPRLEWERDGQYFHYLTKWMHALDQASRATGEPQLNRWATELARTACAGFALRARDGAVRLAWKMSIDLSRPLVPSTGQHDALDGCITCLQLATTAARQGAAGGLEEEIESLAAMSGESDWVTHDPLGIGGLLSDASRVAQLMAGGASMPPVWLRDLLAAALEGLRQTEWRETLLQPASSRLAFRELGLAIGLSALEGVEREMGAGPLAAIRADIAPLLARLAPYVAAGREIESFWLQPEARENPTWLEHGDINDVMLATALAPDGFLVLFNRAPGL